mmetsp:Transcript_65673/g.150549  ORF Transcript_65673/g.150549 Transcript_65673/m.150549 type:complete len:501 (-) Transcript_65673:23-1525(-)
MSYFILQEVLRAAAILSALCLVVVVIPWRRWCRRRRVKLAPPRVPGGQGTLVTKGDVGMGTVLLEEQPLYVGSAAGKFASKLLTHNSGSAAADLVAAILLDKLEESPTGLARLRSLDQFQFTSGMTPPAATEFVMALKTEYVRKFPGNLIAFYFRLVEHHGIAVGAQRSVAAMQCGRLALYRFTNLVSHSCAPNCFVESLDTGAALYPLFPLRASSPLTICFLPPDTLPLPTALRPTALVPCCSRCTGHPEVTICMVCSECGGPRAVPIRPLRHPTPNMGELLQCLDCDAEQKVTPATVQSRLHYSTYQTALTELDAPKDEQSLVIACRTVARLFVELFPEGHPQVAWAFQYAAEIVNLDEDWEGAALVWGMLLGKRSPQARYAERRRKGAVPQASLWPDMSTDLPQVSTEGKSTAARVRQITDLVAEAKKVSAAIETAKEAGAAPLRADPLEGLANLASDLSAARRRLHALSGVVEGMDVAVTRLFRKPDKGKENVANN